MLWLDIFPMDGMPESEPEFRAKMKEAEHLEWCQWQAESKSQDISNPLKRIAKAVLFFILVAALGMIQLSATRKREEQ